MVYRFSSSQASALVRMSWSPSNLFYLYLRTYGPLEREAVFTRTNFSLFQQRFIGRRLLKGYFADWITERDFRKSLPPARPKIPGKDVPLGTLMFINLERRIDVALFRCCFAPDIIAARQMIKKRDVFINGNVVQHFNTLLEPGDIINVAPHSVYMLQNSQSQSLSGEEEASPSEDFPENGQNEQGDQSESGQAADTHEIESDQTQNQPPSSPSFVKSTAAFPTKLDSKNFNSSTSNNGTFGIPTTRVLQKYPTTTLPFKLPPYAAPFLFIPQYWEVSFQTCSAVYLRHPSARSGTSEIPCPYDSEGEAVQLTWEWYTRVTRQNRRKAVKRKVKDDAQTPMQKRTLGLRFTPPEHTGLTRNWLYAPKDSLSSSSPSSHQQQQQNSS